MEEKSLRKWCFVGKSKNGERSSVVIKYEPQRAVSEVCNSNQEAWDWTVTAKKYNCWQRQTLR